MIGVKEFFLSAITAGIVGIGIAIWRSWRKEKASPNASYKIPMSREHKTWLQKINKHIGLLTGDSHTSLSGKRDFIDAMYDGAVPQELWYVLGDQSQLSENKKNEIAVLFWGKNPKPENIKIDPSADLELGNLLKISKPEHFVLELTVNGSLCPLYKTLGIIPDLPGEGCINFVKAYEALQKV